MGNQELQTAIQARGIHLEAATIQRLEDYYGRLVRGNEEQNLTRLTSPVDFVDGHLVDCLELIKSGFLSFPAMDLGSGGGVPGLLSALLGMGPWVLVESERRKAEFLSQTCLDMGLSDTRVVASRGEDFLKKESVEAIVSRAVGSVTKIFGWIGQCSTWNTLVLFKSRGWEGEWSEFKQSSAAKHLELDGLHEYEAGDKYRVIVRLKRIKKLIVPRGT